MKPILYLLSFLIICSFTMCKKVKHTTNTFTLKGNFTGNETADSMFLSHLDTNGKKVVQSAPIIKGSFSFKGIIISPVHADLTSNATVIPVGVNYISNYIRIFLSPVNMTINLKENQFDNAQVISSPSQDEWNDLQKIYGPINKTRDSLYLKMFAIESAGNTAKNHAAHSDVIKKIVKCDSQIDTIDYQYITLHPHSYVSAYLLENLALSAREMRVDSIEMFYGRLSDSIKNGMAGRVILRTIEDLRVHKRPEKTGKNVQQKKN